MRIQILRQIFDRDGIIPIKRLLPKTLFARSLLILVMPVLLIQLITTFVFFDRHWNRMTSRLAFAVSGEIATIALQIENDPSPENVRNISSYTASSLDLLIGFDKGAILEIDPVDNKGAVWGSMVAETLDNEIRNHMDRPFLLDADFEEKWMEVTIQLENGVLSVSLPQRRLFSSSSYIFLIWMIVVSIILLAIAVLFMRNQIRPIRRLAIAAERFGKGRDVHAYKLEGASEVRQAGQAFLDMRKRIQRQITQRTEMLAGVSHDLRTPLTRMKLQLAMLGDSPDVDAMKNDLSEMERMIEGYLEFVRGEGGEQVSMVNLADLLQKVAVSSKRQGRDLTLAGSEDINMMLRPMAFERCLTNLVNNAGKYADHVWIAARNIEDGGKIEITVDDNGPGIPEDKYEDVFKPFYRVDSSRNVATGGVGLGLPIAMDIVHSHGGKIWLEKSGQGGLRVTIHLPV
ncbi:MAG: ATPase [Micavibrio sp.]|nr:MAG: ATPase [Micavibrio sp.]